MTQVFIRGLGSAPPRATIALLAVVCVCAASSAASAQVQVNAQAAALADFQHRLDQYLQLREELVRKLKPLSSTSDASELATRQEALAAALRDVRKMAKKGDLIPTRVAGQIRMSVASDFRRRNAAEMRAVFEEVANGVQPVINRTFPATAALPTVPPMLLNALPRLPDNLQYRFLGRHIVLLDGDAQIIIDYIANVLPPH